MINKNLYSAAVGTFLEWADFSFYAYLAVYFSQLFFPSDIEAFSIFASFCAFAISYLARPIGGYFFGHWGDRLGRRAALTYSLLVMGCTTLAMGLLPTFSVLGVLSPILLMLFRFIQGIAVAGEFAGAGIFLSEHARSKRRYFDSSWVSTFSAAGMLAGALCALLVSMPVMPAWAWRVPFVLGAIACFVGFFIRRHTEETPAFIEAQTQNYIERMPALMAWRKYRFSLIKIFSLASFVGIYIYICNVWWVSFVTQGNYFTPADAKLLATIGQLAVVLFTPLMAWLADRTDARAVMGAGFIGAMILPFMLFLVSRAGLFDSAALSQICYALCNAAVTGVMFRYMSNILSTEVRYSGQALAWNLGVALFGGTAPLLAQWLLMQHAWTIAPAFYVMLSAFVAFILNVLCYDAQDHLLLSYRKDLMISPS